MLCLLLHVKPRNVQLELAPLGFVWLDLCSEHLGVSLEICLHGFTACDIGHTSKHGGQRSKGRPLTHVRLARSIVWIRVESRRI